RLEMPGRCQFELKPNRDGFVTAAAYRGWCRTNDPEGVMTPEPQLPDGRAARRPSERGASGLAPVLLLLLLLPSLLLAPPPGAAPGPVTIATGTDAGGPDVRGGTRPGSPAEQIAPWGSNPLQFSAYPTYQYGVRVAVGDVNGDGKAEIVTAPGKGAWTEIRVF